MQRFRNKPRVMDSRISKMLIPPEVRDRIPNGCTAVLVWDGSGWVIKIMTIEEAISFGLECGVVTVGEEVAE